MISKISILINKTKKSKIIKKRLLSVIENYNIQIDDISPDLIIIIGGDGTFINKIREREYTSSVAFAGINTGHLGFLQDIKENEINYLLKSIIKEEYSVEKLHLQDINIYYGKSNERLHFYSINEIVIREQNLMVLKIKVSLNDTHLENFSGDGFIVSTPTGSTAYNLSIGGSIIYPSIEALQIRPIAPLPMSKNFANLNNSIIIPRDVKVAFEFDKNYKRRILVDIDGQPYPFALGINKITSKLSNKTIKVLRINKYDFCKRINEKFIEF